MWNEKELNLENSRVFYEWMRHELTIIRDTVLHRFRNEYNIDDENLNKSKGQLFNSLKTSDGPDYNDPKIVAAYISDYHLSHCGMTYQIFTNLLSIYHRSQHNREIYLCDIGGGTGAGFIGLELAILGSTIPIRVYFDIIEPSMPMHQASEYFLLELRNRFKLLIRPYRKVLIGGSDFPLKCLQTDAIKILSAFHLALPYPSYPSESTAAQTLKMR